MPAPKPRHLKALSGTLRPDRDKDFPRATPRVGPAPRGLPPEARKLWKLYAARLEELGLASELDRPALERLCVLHGLLKGAEQEMLSFGFTVPDKKGAVKRSPAATLYTQLLKEYRELLKAFGMTPAARQKMEVVTGGEEPDEWEEIFGSEQ